MSEKAPKAPRTRRTGIKQSKFGCPTCKTRKVKCDEQNWPHCNNCTKGGRPCPGWARPPSKSGRLEVNTATHNGPLTPITDSSSPSTTATLGTSPMSMWNNVPPTSIPRWMGTTPQADVVVSRAIEAVRRTHIDDFPFFTDILTRHIFNCQSLYDSTKFAAAAVEVAMEHLQRIDLAHSPQLATNTYSENAAAIKKLREELPLWAQFKYGPSLPLSLLFMYCVELVLRRPQNAKCYSDILFTFFDAQAQFLDPTSDELRDLDVFRRSIEIHRLASADHVVQAKIKPIYLHEDIHCPADAASVGKDLIEIIHACRIFINDVATAFTRGETMEQYSTQHALHLTIIIRFCTGIEQLLQQSYSERESAHLHRLRCISLAMYIELETLFNDSEECYDQHAQYFEKIIASAEQVLASRCRNDFRPELPNFSLQLGIAQPLYFAATKYRQLSSRRRAIACLDNIGQEGPWRGSVLAAVARECAQQEESRALCSTVPMIPTTYSQQGLMGDYANFMNTQPDLGVPLVIPNHCRITACRFVEDNSVSDTDWNNGASPTSLYGSMKSTKVMFLQRTGCLSALPARVLSCVDINMDIEYPGFIAVPLNPEEWFTWSANISF